jgi:hypothetical protein
MVEIPPELLALAGVAPRHDVETGAVFWLNPPHPRYFGATYARPGIVVRVERGAQGVPVRAWLFYTTTKPVSAARRLKLSKGDGGLYEDCSMDNLPFKEMTVAQLQSDCEYLGRLAEATRQQAESMIAGSGLPDLVKGLTP